MTGDDTKKKTKIMEYFMGQCRLEMQIRGTCLLINLVKSHYSWVSKKYAGNLKRWFTLYFIKRCYEIHSTAINFCSLKEINGKNVKISWTLGAGNTDLYHRLLWYLLHLKKNTYNDRRYTLPSVSGVTQHIQIQTNQGWKNEDLKWKIFTDYVGYVKI